MKDRIINSVLSQTLFIVVSGIIGIIQVPLIINMLGQVDFGTLELIGSLMIINFLLEFGMGSTLVKYIPEHKEDRPKLQTFIWSYFYMKMLITLIGCIIVVIIGYYFDNLFKVDMLTDLETVKISVYIFALGILLSSVATFLENILKGFVYFGQANLAKTSAIILFFIFFYLYYLFAPQYDMITISLFWFALRPLITILNSLVAFKRVQLLRILIPTKYDYGLIRNTLRYLFGMSYITIVSQLYNTMPKIILGAYSGPIAVGYWGIMDRIKKPLQDIQGAVLRPLVPILSDKTYSNLPPKTVFQASRLNYLIVSFLGFLIIVNIDLLICVWISKPEFYVVTEYIKILLLRFVFPGGGVLLMMYYARGKTKINSIYLTINTTVSLILSTLLLIVYNELSYFIYAYTFTIILLTQIVTLAYLRYFELNPLTYLREVILPTMLLILSAIFISYYFSAFFKPTIWGLLGSLLSSTIIFLGLFWVFMPQEDKALLHSLIRKLKRG